MSRARANIYNLHKHFKMLMEIRFVDTDAGYCVVWVQIGHRSHDDPRMMFRSVNMKMFRTADLTTVAQLQRLQIVESEWSLS